MPTIEEAVAERIRLHGPSPSWPQKYPWIKLPGFGLAILLKLQQDELIDAAQALSKDHQKVVAASWQVYDAAVAYIVEMRRSLPFLPPLPALVPRTEGPLLALYVIRDWCTSADHISDDIDPNDSLGEVQVACLALVTKRLGFLPQTPRPRPRGRPARTPTQKLEDAKLAGAWDTHQWPTYAALERELNVPAGAVRRAIDNRRSARKG